MGSAGGERGIVQTTAKGERAERGKRPAILRVRAACPLASTAVAGGAGDAGAISPVSGHLELPCLSVSSPGAVVLDVCSARTARN